MRYLDGLGRAHLFENIDEALECSNCGAEYYRDGNNPKEWEYCPLCGRKLSPWSDLTYEDCRENEGSWKDDLL